jgi:FAD/FMN-containing dehydrogenase
MAADHVLSISLVTADGHFITASPTQNQDIFWAVCGGGHA